MATVLVFRIDYDGCLGSGVILNQKMLDGANPYQVRCAFPEFHPAITINQPLLNHIYQTVLQHPDCQKIVIQIGTNRQTAFIDIFNGAMHASGSCLSAYENLVSCLQGYFGPAKSVVLEPALLGDFEHGAQEGSTFSQIQAYKGQTIAWYTDPPKEAFSNAVLSEPYKLLLNYFLNQRLAEQYRGQTIWVDFIDDRVDILTQSTTFFDQNPYLCPNGITVRAVRYAGVNEKIAVMERYAGRGILRF